ncbi:MAG TPA: hypothetical protein VM389_13095 [Phycisphaerae bacterium]|nr:hypothetical protein [Phycisphaerae bacterium]
MLFGLILSPIQIAVVVLAVIAVVAVIMLLSIGVERVRTRRKLATDAAKVLMEEGFEMCAEACSQYGVGDYPSFFGTLRELVRQLLNPETRVMLLRKPFRKQLVAALDRDEDREWVLKTVTDWTATQNFKAARDAVAKKAVAAAAPPA